MIKMEYKCEICRAEFYHKQYLTKHKSRVHGIKTRSATTDKFPCSYCDKRFSSKKSLSEHRVKIHNVKKLTIACQETNCYVKFHQLCELRNHLMREHEIPNINNCQNLEFEKYEDFREWLAEEEKNSDSKYVLSSGKTVNSCTYRTFSCNRSGTYKPTTDDRQRQLKAQGTRKLGFHCTSSVQVKEIHSKVLVSYYKEHYKHSKDLDHLPIPKAEKEAIAGKLLQGVKEKVILKDIRKNSESNLQRTDLITMKDLHNIKKEFGLLLDGQESVVNDDETSVSACVRNTINRHEFNKIKIASLSAKLNSLPNMDENVANQIDHHLNAIQHLMQITGEKILRPQNIAKSEPSDKKIVNQKRFHSVRKPHSSKKIKICNPSSEEATEKQIYCSNNSSFDHTY